MLRVTLTKGITNIYSITAFWKTLPSAKSSINNQLGEIISGTWVQLVLLVLVLLISTHPTPEKCYY